MPIDDFLKDKSLEQGFKSMPAFHTTKFSTFELISESELIPTRCEVMNMNLVYLFYGRSSYSKESEGQIELEDILLAVSMGIETNDLREKEIHKIYPFDSGAFKKGMYEKHINKAESLDQYSIPNGDVNLYIKEFFGNEKNYLDGLLNKMNNNTNDEHVLKLRSLISDYRDPSFDTRARTIEILYKDKIPLTNIKILVIHERHENNDAVKKILKLNDKVKILKYDTEEVGNEKDIYVLIRNKVKKCMKEYLEVNE